LLEWTAAEFPISHPEDEEWIEDSIAPREGDWDFSAALTNFISFRCKRSSACDVDELTVDFLNLTEPLQRQWIRGPPKEYASDATTKVDRDYFEAVESLLRFAESPTSKFLDLVVLHVNDLIAKDGENPHLIALLKSISWTGTQPGAPFNDDSRRCLGDWLKSIELQ
jgi:hypothetical protein